MDWEPGPQKGEHPYVPDVDGAVTLTPVSGEKNLYAVNVSIENLGANPLHQALVYIGCATSGTWDGIVVPLGRVESNDKAVGRATIRLRAGVAARTDEVTATLRAHDTVPIVVARTPFSSVDDPPPAVQMSARLEGNGKDKTVHITVRHDSARTLEGVELSFEHPGDVRVELLEAAARIPSIAPGAEAATQLGVRVDESWDAAAIPLRLVVEGDVYRGALARWPVSLPVDGRTVALQAPEIMMNVPTSHAVGPYVLPISVMDDGPIQHVTVAVNGTKTSWLPGGNTNVSEPVTVHLVQGPNRIRVKTQEAQGIRQAKTVWIWGEEPVSADALSSDP